MPNNNVPRSPDRTLNEDDLKRKNKKLDKTLKQLEKINPNSRKYNRKIFKAEKTLDQIQTKKEGIRVDRNDTPLYGKISSACKAAAKRKFKVWPSAYASGWGVRCTKAGGPSKFGGGKK